MNMNLGLTDTLNRVLGSKGIAKKGFVLLNTTKKKIVAASLAFTLAVGGGAVAYNHFNGGSAADVPAPQNPVVTNDSDTPTDTPVAADQFGILADGLEIDGLGMKNDMLTIEEQAQKIAEEMGATYDGPSYDVTDKDGNTQSWVSEDDYKKAVDAGLEDAPVGTEKVTYEDDVFVADDGTPFGTAADRDAWNAYLKQQNSGKSDTVIETEGNVYVAEDGTVWASKEDADAYKNSQNGTATAVTDGEVVEAGEGYRDPEGNYWTSEAEYQAYISGANNITGGNNVVGGSDVIYEDDNLYHAPDGSVWASEAEYQAYISNTNNVVGGDNVVGGSDVIYENDNFYHAPDGSVWASEAEYQDYINSQNSMSATFVQNTSTSSQTQEPQIETKDNFYHAPDGSVWASEAEYQAFVNSQQSEDTVSAQALVQEAPVQEAATQEQQVEATDNFYYAPDGSVWASEADYNAFVNSAVEETQEVVESSVEEEKKSDIVLDEYGGYIDPETGFYCVDGEYYATKADYIAYRQMENGNDNEKTM